MVKDSAGSSLEEDFDKNLPVKYVIAQNLGIYFSLYEIIMDA